MTEIRLTKVDSAILIPEDTESLELLEKIRRGEVIRCTFTKMRSAAYHRKFFAMLGIGYDAWEPQLDDMPAHSAPPAKLFEAFRKSITIAAGFYSATYVMRIDGSTAVELTADSISFANMDQPEFERVYSKVADVILQRVLVNYTRDDLDAVVDKILAMV